MPYNRKAYAPYSQSAEAGITQAPVDGLIEVEQYIKPVIQAGKLGQDGKWLIAPNSDTSFFVSDKAEGIPNGAEVLFPNTANADFIDMAGFRDIFIAINVSNGGGYAVKAVMGPDTTSFANLSPVNPASDLKGAVRQTDFNNLLVDGADSMTADVWNIFYIQNSLVGQMNMQFKVTNNSGGSGNIDFAYMRIV